MGKMATTLDDKLPEFQKYLLEKNLAPAKNVPFYAHWVSRFLDYARRNEFSALEYQEVAVLGFLDSLKNDACPAFHRICLDAQAFSSVNL
jgi:hypothetical protein